MNQVVEKKLECLKKKIRDTKGCAVAYSGGVDSSLLLAVAFEELGDRCIAVIATSSTYPKRELESAVSWLVFKDIPYEIIVSEELDIDGFADNPPNRCYFCKKELFSKLINVAKERGFEVVFDGANADDLGDFRPGMQAARELGVISPLLDCGLTKDEIRQLSREVYNLPTADKQPMACMSSRFPYGMKITNERLNQVEKVEDYLHEIGFKTFRARHHGDILRLELGKNELKTIQDEQVCADICKIAKEAGFIYVTLDLEGFRSGSMNEVLK